MTIAFRNSPKLGVGVAKDKCESSSTPAHLNKRLRLERILKNYIGSDFNQKHATPAFDSESTTLT